MLPTTTLVLPTTTLVLPTTTLVLPTTTLVLDGKEAGMAIPTSVAREWGRRVAAEYASAALTAELLHWLFQLGVSPDTLDECHRIVADEQAHAELSRDVVLAAGGSDAAVQIDGALLRIPHLPDAPLLERALHVCADFYCCGETVARPLFREMLRHATVDVAHTALARIAKDEARHSAFGWSLLDELLQRCDDAQRAALRERVASYIQRIASGYGGEVQAPRDDIDDVERSWGLLAPASYHTLSAQGVDELIRPRFAKHGLC